jgi:N-acetylglucosamine-6-sulfatase
LEDRLVFSHAPVTETQPNIVFIMSDDQDIATMQYMPRVQALLADQGVTFANSFVSEPQCCPSNVTALTGQYAHNHGVLNNLYPTGGFEKFVENGGDQSTLATWLDDAGYNTARVGKYLVGYPENSTYIPPGWNEWYSTFGGEGRYFNYSLNENGTVVPYGSAAEDYATDVLTSKASSPSSLRSLQVLPTQTACPTDPRPQPRGISGCLLEPWPLELRRSTKPT